MGGNAPNTNTGNPPRAWSWVSVNEAGDELYIYGRHGNINGSQYQYPLSIVDGANYNWARGLWKVDLSDYSTETLISLDDPAVLQYTDIAYDDSDNRIYVSGGSLLASNASNTNQGTTTNITQFHDLNSPNGFELLEVGTAYPAEGGPLWYDGINDRLLHYGESGLWSLSLAPPGPVEGCTDPTACNFNPQAIIDDGTCSGTCIDGCTDPTACNFNPDATQDDGSCIELELPTEISGLPGEVIEYGSGLSSCASTGHATFDGLPTSGGLGEVISLPSDLLAGAGSWSWAYQFELIDNSRGTLLCKHSSGENTYQTIGIGYTVAGNGHPSNLANNHLTLHTQNGRPNAVSNAILNPGLHTIGMTYDGTTLRMFIDGEFDSQHTGNFSLTNDITYSSYTIGRLFYSYNEYRFRGQLHWAGFSNSAMSDDDMLSWMNCAFDYPSGSQAIYLGGQASNGVLPNHLNPQEFEATYSGLDVESGVGLDYDIEWSNGQSGLPIDLTIGEVQESISGIISDGQGSTCNVSVTISPLIGGCTDPTACNYEQDADFDSNNCTYPGCTDIEACNFAAEAGCDDGSCVYPPLVELGANKTLCEGQSLDLSVDAPGLTTTWSTGATGPAISVTETGTYSVQSGGEFGADYRLEFDGIDDYVSFGSSLNITTYPFSIQADITIPSDYWPILYTDDGTDGYSGIWFEIGPEIVAIAVGEGSGGGPNNRRSKSGSHGLPAGTTATVSAVVRGATDMSLYVNGVDIGGNHSGSGNTTFVDNGLDAVIGRRTPSSGPALNQLQYHDGTLDNLHVWTKALTAEEVAQFVDTPADGAEDGLLAVYTFDEGAGTSSTDGANGVEAQLFGNPTWVLEEAGCSASDTITVHVIDCETLCGPGTTWDPILQSCVAEVPETTAAEDCSLFTLQELSTGYLNQQQQMDALDTLVVTQQAAIDSLNALLNNCTGND